MLVNCTKCGYPVYFSSDAVGRGEASRCGKCDTTFSTDASGRAIAVESRAPESGGEGIEAAPPPQDEAEPIPDVEPIDNADVEDSAEAETETDSEDRAEEESGTEADAEVESPTPEALHELQPPEPEPIDGEAPAGSSPEAQDEKVEVSTAPEPVAVSVPSDAPVEPSAPVPVSAALSPVSVPGEIPESVPHVSADIVYLTPYDDTPRVCRTSRLDEGFVLMSVVEPLPRILPAAGLRIGDKTAAVEIRPDEAHRDATGLVPARYHPRDVEAQNLISELLETAREHGGWLIACPICARSQPVAAGTLEGQMALTSCVCGFTTAVGPGGVILDLDSCPTCGAGEPAAAVAKKPIDGSVSCKACGTVLLKDTFGRVVATSSLPAESESQESTSESKPRDSGSLEGCPTCGRLSDVIYLRRAPPGKKTSCLGCGTVLTIENDAVVAIVPGSEGEDAIDAPQVTGVIEEPTASEADTGEDEEAATAREAMRKAAEAHAAGELAAKEKAAAARAAAEADAERAMAAAAEQRAAADKAIAEADEAKAAANKAAVDAANAKADAEKSKAEAAEQRAIIEKEAAERAVAAQKAAERAAEEAAAARQAAERFAIDQEATVRAAVRRATAEQTEAMQAAVEQVALQQRAAVQAAVEQTAALREAAGYVAIHESGAHPALSPAASLLPGTGIRPAPKPWPALIGAVVVGALIGLAVVFAIRGGASPAADTIRQFQGANALVRDGRAEEAIPIFRQIIATDPDFPLAHRHLGVAYALTGKRQEARRAYKAYLDRATDPVDATHVRKLLADSEAAKKGAEAPK